MEMKQDMALFLLQLLLTISGVIASASRLPPS